MIASEQVFHDPNGELKGVEGYKQLCRACVTAFPDCHFAIDGLIAEEDRVSLRYTFAGTRRRPLRAVPATGKRASVPGVSVTYFAEGRIVTEHALRDTLGLM